MIAFLKRQLTRLWDWVCQMGKGFLRLFAKNFDPSTLPLEGEGVITQPTYYEAASAWLRFYAGGRGMDYMLAGRQLEESHQQHCERIVAVFSSEIGMPFIEDMKKLHDYWYNKGGEAPVVEAWKVSYARFLKGGRI